MTSQNRYIDAEICRITEAMEKNRKGKFAYLKVLIVDDQPEMRTLISDMLGEIGITNTLEASCGEEAMKFIGEKTLHIILCDWNMPNMNGLEFLRHVRSIDTEVHFLMITSRNDGGSLVDAMMAGASAYIRKPFSPEQLENKLRILLLQK